MLSDFAYQLADYLVEAGATSVGHPATSEVMIRAFDIIDVSEFRAALNELLDGDFVRRRNPQSLQEVMGYYVNIDRYNRLVASLNSEIEISADASIEDRVEAVIVPASDRLVPLDHNSSEYQVVSQGLKDLEQRVRENNSVGETAEERDQILKSIAAARELWSAAQLSIMQIRIGVVLAVESAINALIEVGQSVGKSLVQDAIKTYVKNKTGIDY